MAKSNKVYVRRPGTRERERATNKNSVATGTTFCLRYMRNGKRCWETLENVTSFAQAQKAAIDRNVDLTVGRAVPVPEPRPEPSTPKPSVKTGAVPLDVAIDTYNRNVASRSGKTVSGYAATMKQFYASCRKPFVQDVTQQDLIDFVTYLRATGVGDRTISNRLVEVGTFLKASGVKGCGPVPVSSSLPSCQTTPPWLTVRMEVDGVSVCLLVDTGASGIFLFQSEFAIDCRY